MNLQNILVKYDINRKIPFDMTSVTHVNDVGTRILELALFEGKQPLAVGASRIVQADIVTRKTRQLLKSGISCAVNEAGHILVPVDSLQVRGRLDINVEVTVKDNANHTVLALPYPIWVRVNPSVLDDAEVIGDSTGTVPELLERAEEQLSRVEGFVEETRVFDILDAALSGDPTNAPALLLDNAADQAGNPNGHYMLYYTDSDFGRHNLFDFSTAFYTKAEVNAAIQAAIGGVENGSY